MEAPFCCGGIVRTIWYQRMRRGRPSRSGLMPRPPTAKIFRISLGQAFGHSVLRGIAELCQLKHPCPDQFSVLWLLGSLSSPHFWPSHRAVQRRRRRTFRGQQAELPVWSHEAHFAPRLRTLVLRRQDPGSVSSMQRSLSSPADALAVFVKRQSSSGARPLASLAGLVCR